jgi:hypothetical protein
VFRPALADNPTGKHNFGGRLSALALDAGELLTSDVEVIHRSIVLPQNKGTLDMDLRVTGPLAFLTAKIDALHGRDKPKNAYDIVWLLAGWSSCRCPVLSTTLLLLAPRGRCWS